MRPDAAPKTRSLRSEQIILFRVSRQLFAVSSSSVQEVRSVDSLAGVATEIAYSPVRKVRHLASRGEKTIYVVNAALHFGLPPSPSALVFVFRNTRTALLVDAIEQMASMTHLQALPLAFHNEERSWYRGLTAMDQAVIPVINPGGFLSDEEIALLDEELTQPASAESSTGASPTQ